MLVLIGFCKPTTLRCISKYIMNIHFVAYFPKQFGNVIVTFCDEDICVL